LLKNEAQDPQNDDAANTQAKAAASTKATTASRSSTIFNIITLTARCPTHDKLSLLQKLPLASSLKKSLGSWPGDAVEIVPSCLAGRDQKSFWGKTALRGSQRPIFVAFSVAHRLNSSHWSHHEHPTDDFTSPVLH
jgi:hypothetical protein